MFVFDHQNQEKTSFPRLERESKEEEEREKEREKEFIFEISKEWKEIIQKTYISVLRSGTNKSEGENRKKDSSSHSERERV